MTEDNNSYKDNFPPLSKIFIYVLLSHKINQDSENNYTNLLNERHDIRQSSLFPLNAEMHFLRETHRHLSVKCNLMECNIFVIIHHGKFYACFDRSP